MSKVRVFSLDDLSNGKTLPRRKSAPVEAAREEGAPEDGVAMQRKREETQARSHVFLRQTVPPKDPVVREVERRRSGGDE